MTRRETPLDARRILEVLAELAVDYVVIGGLAVQAHGHTRTTQDLDLVPAGDEENLRRRALVIDLRGLRVAIAGLDDLIAMKRAAGRPIDRGDVIALTEPRPGWPHPATPADRAARMIALHDDVGPG